MQMLKLILLIWIATKTKFCGSVTASNCALSYEYDYSFASSYDYESSSGPRSLRFFHPWGISRFGSQSYHRYVKARILTCSKIPATMRFNYTEDILSYDELVIVDSTIPFVPLNSTLSKLTSAKKVILTNLGIEKLSPGVFDDFKSLETLNLASNKLTEFPSGIISLTSLDLSNNFISDLHNISDFVNLQELFLNHNNISILRDHLFDNLRNLRIFRISDNPLEEFHNVGFTNLREFTARNTHLKNLKVELSNLAGVSQIDLSGGFFETIDFTQLPPSNSLDLSSNYIDTVNNWDQLKSHEVNLSRNRITAVGAIGQNVNRLDLSHNKIKILSNTMNQSRINAINLDYNDIAVIDVGVFHGLIGLRSVSLKYNNLSVIQKNTVVNCSKLEIVDLSHNRIEHIESNAFKDVPNLVRLNISHNLLTSLNCEMLPKGTHLRELSINNNAISGFNPVKCLQQLSNLEILSMKQNSWLCEDLSYIWHILKVRGVQVPDSEHFSGDNGNKIACDFEKRS